MAAAYAGIAVLWALCWWAMVDPGDPWWAPALAALPLALLAFLPAALAGCPAWNAVLGLIEGFREGSSPLRPRVPRSRGNEPGGCDWRTRVIHS